MKIEHKKAAEAEAQVRQKADEFYHNFGMTVKVKYAELEKHGVLEAWLTQRGQTEPKGKYDYVTIGQAVALGLIKNMPNS